MNEIEDVVLTPIYSKNGFSDYLVDVINGRIWSKKSNKGWLTSNPNSNGYCYVSLTDDNGVAHRYGVHRLIMCSYTGIPLEMFCRGGIEIDHINEEEKWNNRLDNLQMSSRKAQYKESTRAKMGKGKRLKEEEVCDILNDLVEWASNENNKLSTFIHSKSKFYNQTYRNIWNIVYRKTWTHLHEESA